MQPYTTSNYKENNQDKPRYVGKAIFSPKDNGPWDCIKGLKGEVWYDYHGYGSSSYFFRPFKNPWPGNSYVVNHHELKFLERK